MKNRNLARTRKRTIWLYSFAADNAHLACRKMK